MSNYTPKIKSYSDSELKGMLVGAREELRSIRFAKNPLGNVKEASTIKKNIARILTELRIRELNKSTAI